MWYNVIARYIKRSISMRIIVDTETTGFRAGTDELLQISIIDQNRNVLFNEYFKPTTLTEWKEAEAVNHISPNMVKDCPCVEDRLTALQEIFDKADTIIGYNTQFDIGFLKAAGITLLDSVQYVDVMREFAPLYGQWNEKKQEWKFQKLTTCADYYGYDWNNASAHNSLGDCYATLYCYNKIHSEA